MTTKLMVRADLRGSAATQMLISEAYAAIRANDSLFDFIDCNPHLVPLYQRLGYRRYKANIDHPDYGTVIPMVLLTADVDHLRKVGSPFLDAARASAPHPESVAFFQRAFPAHADEEPLWTLGTEQLWRLLSEGASGATGALRGLAPEEIASIVRHGAIVEYQPGERVFMQGETSQAMFLLLSGRVDVSMRSGAATATIARLGVGDIFGEIGVIGGSPRTASIVVTEPARLVVINRSVLDRLEKSDPKLAGRLLRRLFEIVAQRLTSANDRAIAAGSGSAAESPT